MHATFVKIVVQSFFAEWLMVEREHKLVILDEHWRKFFVGALHQQISMALSEAFSQLFKICVAEKIISDPKEEVSRLSRLESKDLSDTTNLIFTRFETIFKNNNGINRSTSVTQMLNSLFRNPGNYRQEPNTQNLRATLQKARELENISNILKLGRNLNAHVQNQILDVGLSLQICASILRLFETFDFERVPREHITNIRNLAESIVVNSAKNTQALDVKLSSSIRGPSPPLDNADANIKSVIEKKTKTESINQDIEINGFQEDIPLDGSVTSKELKRQKLEQLKLVLIQMLKSDGTEYDRKDLILYGSNLSDILAYQPKDVDDIKNVLSIKFLMSKNSEFVNYQLQIVGAEIVSIFS